MRRWELAAEPNALMNYHRAPTPVEVGSKYKWLAPAPLHLSLLREVIIYFFLILNMRIPSGFCRRFGITGGLSELRQLIIVLGAGGAHLSEYYNAMSVKEQRCASQTSPYHPFLQLVASYISVAFILHGENNEVCLQLRNQQLSLV